jgi:hypothetical protein
MSADIKPLVERVLARAPEWIRRDLLAKERSSRARAEEALAAMNADALNESTPAVD